MSTDDWLTVVPGEAPLVLSLPHTGTDIPRELLSRFVSPWLACKDADWYLELLFDFLDELGVTSVHTMVSRSVIDVNRDPTGASLYPGMVTTALCPTETFDGEKLYLDGAEPDAAEIEIRQRTWFDPYHAALRAEIDRLRQTHNRVVLFDGHSIRSVVPRLFEGTLPHLNLGTNDGASCAADARFVVENICRATPFTHVSDGRFKGGWITRHYGRPLVGVHALQMEVACRTYLAEKLGPVAGEDDWPPGYSDEWAAPARDVLRQILTGLIDWARKG
jgi:formiminoglutamase